MHSFGRPIPADSNRGIMAKKAGSEQAAQQGRAAGEEGVPAGRQRTTSTGCWNSSRSSRTARAPPTAAWAELVATYVKSKHLHGPGFRDDQPLEKLGDSDPEALWLDAGALRRHAGQVRPRPHRPGAKANSCPRSRTTEPHGDTTEQQNENVVPYPQPREVEERAGDAAYDSSRRTSSRRSGAGTMSSRRGSRAACSRSSSSTRSIHDPACGWGTIMTRSAHCWLCGNRSRHRRPQAPPARHGFLQARLPDVARPHPGRSSSRTRRSIMCRSSASTRSI